MHHTQQRKVTAAAAAAAGGNDDVQGAMLEPSVANTPWVSTKPINVMHLSQWCAQSQAVLRTLTVHPHAALDHSLQDHIPARMLVYVHCV
jgi:hypothetical protein